MFKINKQKLLIFVCAILMLQIFRNISLVGYIGILFIAYLSLYISYLGENGLKRDLLSISVQPIQLLFILSLLWLPIISIFQMDIYEYITSLSRFLVTLPIIIYLFIYQDYTVNLTKMFMKMYVTIVVIAALTIPYQILFGRISFFAEPSFREGFIRYASLLGSLTALGTIGGVAIAILLFMGNQLFTIKTRVFLISVIVIGMMLSLQKSAILNIIIVFIFFLLANRNIILIIKRLVSIVSVIVVGGGLMIGLNLLNVRDRILGIIKYTFQSNDYGIVNDLLIRVTDLPSKVFSFHEINLLDLTIGIGFKALAGILGNPEYPMAHNNYIDLLLSGGLLHLTTFLLLICGVIYYIVKIILCESGNTEIEQSYVVCLVLILINMMIGSASFYQPPVTILLFYIVFSYNRLEKRKSDNYHCK